MDGKTNLAWSFLLGSSLLLLAIPGPVSGLQVKGSVQMLDSIVGKEWRKMIGVAGAEIVFINAGKPQEIFATVTDGQGNYEIDLDAPTHVENESRAKPISFKLNQNYPNPFNPGTVISYQLPEAVPVRLEIYNSLGQRVRTLVDDLQEAGPHGLVWDGRDDSGRGLASGVYLYRLVAGSFTESRKMVLVDGISSRPAPGTLSGLSGLSRSQGGRKLAKSLPGGLSGLDLVEGDPHPLSMAGKIVQGRSYHVKIDGFKLIPFERAGVVVNADTAITFTVEEDVRENVVFLKEGQRQLFLDDFVIEEARRLRRVMHQPVKKGAVIRPNWPAGETGLQTRSTVFWDPLDGVFKIWLIDRLCRFSTDGLHWTLWDPPIESTGEVVFDPFDPDPARRYKSFSPKKSAHSPDGMSWSVLKREIRIEGQTREVLVTIRSSDEWNFSLDAEDRLYIATVKRSGPYGRSVYLALSRDFENWTEARIIFHTDDLDQELGHRNIAERFADQSLHHPPWNDSSVYNVDTYNMGVFRYESVYIGTPSLYHAVGPVPNYPNTVGFHLVQLAVSRDLKEWERVGDRQPFIGPSRRDSGAYDLTQLIGPSNALVRGDELWFYYTGIKYRGGWRYEGTFPHGEIVPLPGYEEDRGAICLAVLRRDGFVSLDADEGEGVLLTRPLVWRGSTLWVNADAAEGEVEVEVLNEDGAVLGDWSRAQALPLSEDGVRLEMNWNGSGDLGNLRGQLVRLRFYLRNADLYAFWTE